MSYKTVSRKADKFALAWPTQRPQASQAQNVDARGQSAFRHRPYTLRTSNQRNRMARLYDLDAVSKTGLLKNLKPKALALARKEGLPFQA